MPGASIGKSVVEFKKGIKGIEEEIDVESSRPSAPPRLEQDSTEDFAPEASETAKSESKTV